MNRYSSWTVTVLIFTSSLLSYAQEAEEAAEEYGWKNGGLATLNLTQASFDNWEQGGENTLSWQVILNADFVLDNDIYNCRPKANFPWALQR